MSSRAEEKDAIREVMARYCHALDACRFEDVAGLFAEDGEWATDYGIARGEVALGFQQRSELIHVEGVDVIGAMPPGLEIVTVFSGAIGAASQRFSDARALLEFVRSAATDNAKRRHGLQPARAFAGKSRRER